jgi:hypothetical protein
LPLGAQPLAIVVVRFLIKPQTGFMTSEQRSGTRNSFAGKVGAGAPAGVRLAPQTGVAGNVGDAAAGFADGGCIGGVREPDAKNERHGKAQSIALALHTAFPAAS